MGIFGGIYATARYVLVTFILVVIVLMILRLIVNYADMNPFGAFARNVKLLTDPLIDPVKKWLIFRGFNYKLAPLITILMIILAGYLGLSLIGDVLFTVKGVLVSLSQGMIIPLIGCLLYGLLSIFLLLVLVRIILSWIMLYGNRWTRWVTNVTEPILGPFRRLIPPIGGFDFSPVVVMFLIQLFQQAILGTMIPNAALFVPR